MREKIEQIESHSSPYSKYTADGRCSLLESKVSEIIDILNESIILTPEVYEAQRKEYFNFTEWAGEHYIKVNGGWFGRFEDQRDLKNLRTTEQIYGYYMNINRK